MRKAFGKALVLSAGLLLIGCSESQQTPAEAARNGGGSMEGAGGAGPGYDGSGRSSGKHGTVPDEHSGVGAGLLTKTNEALNKAATNSPKVEPGPDQRPSR